MPPLPAGLQQHRVLAGTLPAQYEFRGGLFFANLVFLVFAATCLTAAAETGRIFLLVGAGFVGVVAISGLASAGWRAHDLVGPRQLIAELPIYGLIVGMTLVGIGILGVILIGLARASPVGFLVFVILVLSLALFNSPLHLGRMSRRQTNYEERLSDANLDQRRPWFPNESHVVGGSGGGGSNWAIGSEPGSDGSGGGDGGGGGGGGE